MHINEYTIISHSEGIFEGAKPFLIYLGSKLMYIPVRTHVLTFFVLFILFYFYFILFFIFYSHRSFAVPSGV
jgi:hypothetical protein